MADVVFAPMLSAFDLNLHDGLLEKMFIYYESRRITLEIMAYLDDKASDRVLVKIIFTGVRYFNHSGDMKAMKKNYFAGTINDWKCATSENEMSYLYLVDGCISIQAKKIKLKI